MSHFTVLVVGDNPDEQLAAFHEYESTGRDDEHVVAIDETDEVRAEYEADEATMLRVPPGTVVTADDMAVKQTSFGPVVSAYDDRFYRDATPEEATKIGRIAGTGSGHGMSWTSRDWGDGRGYRTKVRYTPEGYEEVSVPRRELMTFTAYVTEYRERQTLPEGIAALLSGDDSHRIKYGYAVLNDAGEIVKVVRRTNAKKYSWRDAEGREVVRTIGDAKPESTEGLTPFLVGGSKWDWYSLGGRWTGFFKLRETVTAATVGEPGLMTPVAESGTADEVRKGDVDFETMRNEAAEEARSRWLTVHGIISGMEYERWTSVQARHGDDVRAARAEYWAQPSVVAVQEAAKQRRNDEASRWLSWVQLDDYDCPLATYEQRARDGAAVPFAVLKDGVWYERGGMGWFGIVTDEKDRDEWNAQVAKLYDELPDDAVLSIYDCHI